MPKDKNNVLAGNDDNNVSNLADVVVFIFDGHDFIYPEPESE